MGAAVVHFELNAKDGKRAQEFFRNLFDWKIDTNNPMGYGLVDTGLKMGINGGIGQVPEGQPSDVLFYVQVEDLQAYLDKAVSLGGRIVTPVEDVPNVVTFATFADPEGNVVGLVKGPQTPPRSASARKKSSPRRRKPATRRGHRPRKRTRR